MIEEQVLSKIINEQNIYAVLKYNVTKEDFPTLGEVFEFIYKENVNHRTVPSMETVTHQFPDFEYLPNVSEPFSALCTRLKQQTAKRKAFELLQNQAAQKFQDLPGDQFVSWLKTETDKIEKLTSSAFYLGTNFAVNGRERKERYESSKEYRSKKFIETPYPTLNKYLYGLELGDYALLMAFTNRGKSWIASDIGINAWRKGFGVLHYSPELSKRQQETRLETLDKHFNNMQLRRGELDPEKEQEYYEYLGDFEPGDDKPPYIIKTMGDLPKGLTVDVIEADLEINPEIGLVIIDGFNLMTHKGGRSNRDAMTNTSRRLRQIFGKFEVAGLVVHQTPGAAEKENKETDEAGARIVKPPELDQYSETIAVIQDASTVLTFDAHDGVGKIAIRKAREPHVGEVIDLQCNFNMGYIREPDATDIF